MLQSCSIFHYYEMAIVLWFIFEGYVFSEIFQNGDNELWFKLRCWLWAFPLHCPWSVAESSGTSFVLLILLLSMCWESESYSAGNCVWCVPVFPSVSRNTGRVWAVVYDQMCEFKLFPSLKTCISSHNTFLHQHFQYNTFEIFALDKSDCNSNTTLPFALDKWLLWNFMSV